MATKFSLAISRAKWEHGEIVVGVVGVLSEGIMSRQKAYIYIK